MFLEKLWELITKGWEFVSPFEVIKDFEGGVILRLGKYNRTIGPGLNFKWPILETVISVTTCITTLRLPSQAVMTKDDVQVVVCGIVKYEVRDVKPFALLIWDRVDVLGDISMGAIKTVVNTSDYASLVNPGVATEQAILEAVRKEVNQYGFKVHKVTLIDLARCRTLKLMQDSLPVSNVNNGI